MRKWHIRYAVFFLALGVLFGGFAACGDDDDDNDDAAGDDDYTGGDDDATGGDYDDWLGALPDAESLELTLPGADEVVPQTLGQTAEYYIETVQMTRDTNETMLAFLSMIDEIASYEPTTVDGDTAVWGPIDGTGLEIVDWRFTMIRLGDTHFTYAADWRPKASGNDADFVTVWEGEVEDAETTQRRGIGWFTLHFSDAFALDPTVEATGEIAVTYDTLNPGRHISLDYADFLPDDVLEPVNGIYDYVEAADGSGDFLFDVWADIHFEDWGSQFPEPEHMRFNTRWLADGVGRCDIAITDGEIPEMHELLPDQVPFALDQVNLSECWDDGFGRVYFAEELVAASGTTYVIQDTLEGDEADCGFTRDLPAVE